MLKTETIERYLDECNVTRGPWGYWTELKPILGIVRSIEVALPGSKWSEIKARLEEIEEEKK